MLFESSNVSDEPCYTLDCYAIPCLQRFLAFDWKSCPGGSENFNCAFVQAPRLDDTTIPILPGSAEAPLFRGAAGDVLTRYFTNMVREAAVKPIETIEKIKN